MVGIAGRLPESLDRGNSFEASCLRHRTHAVDVYWT